MQIEKVIEKLIESAAVHQLMRHLRSDHRRENSPETLKRNAREVGKLIESLPAEERSLLATLTADDLARRVFHGYEAHMRPERPSRQRVRGPVSFG